VIGDWFGNWLEFMSHGENIAFSLLAVVIISGAVFMINMTRVVHMVVSIAAVFLGLGGLYVLLEAEFVAFVQVLIYAGAVTILMVFGIMMTRYGGQEEQQQGRPLANALLLVGTIGLFLAIFFAIQNSLFPGGEALLSGEDNTRAIGQAVFAKYVIPFELVSVLLTVAFIGAIVLAKREEE
jgi:NADH-quinone oxidoreductase subunit J